MKLLITILLLLTGPSSFSQPSGQSARPTDKNFRAAVVKKNITPDRPQWLRGYNPRISAGVHDSIYHRIVVLDDGNTRFVLVSTDICVFSPVFYDDVASEIESRFNIKPLNFWWSLTHTHSAPEVATNYGAILYPVMANRRELADQNEKDSAYTTMIKQKLAEGIDEALKNLVPARLGVAWGFSQANINRRAIDADGKASLGMNPDGPVDRKIGILKIENEKGEPIAVIANYPVHGTVMGGKSQVISGDAPGIVAGYVEEKTGAPLLFINGAAGNLAPIYSVFPNPRAGHLSQFKVLLGDKIINACNQISHTTDAVTLETGKLIVETRQHPDLDLPHDMGNYTRTTLSGEKIIRLPVRFLHINDDIAIWSAPVELFCEISNAVRNSSPYPYTFYFGYTNGVMGYLVAENEYQHEGYEPAVSPFTPRADKDLTNAVITYLQEK